MITIATLLAGRFYTAECFFHGLSIIDYPKDQIDLVFLTNSDSDMFVDLMEKKTSELEGYHSVRFLKTDLVPPSSNAFVENGEHTAQHAETIAKLYNELYTHIETEDFLFLEDDIIAPANAIKDLLRLSQDSVGYVCGVQIDRHQQTNNSIFMWDLIKKRVYPEGDSCDAVTYAAAPVRKPWGVREIGLGHFGLTLLKKSVCDRLPKPIFKSSLAEAGSLVGCDMVFCIEIEKLGLKKICNFDVRGHHIDSLGKIH